MRYPVRLDFDDFVVPWSDLYCSLDLNALIGPDHSNGLNNSDSGQL
jgi:hypothetical protein